MLVFMRRKRFQSFKTSRSISFALIPIILGLAPAILAEDLRPTTLNHPVFPSIGGHPTELTPAPNAPVPRPTVFGNDTGLPDDFEVSPFSPLVSGSFVNFEGPPTKPLALSSDGQTLFAVHTPDNRLAVMSTVGGLSVVKEIPVGLEPVAVAVQPGTADQLVWVANFISDTVNVVDVASGRIVATVEVGDEPVNVLFNPAGTHAFVVIQGSRTHQTYELDSLNLRLGHLVVVDTATRKVVSTTYLDCNTPRSAVYDATNHRLIVAALHSGNNTTVVGQPITLKKNVPMPGFVDSCDVVCNCDCQYGTLLEVLRDFGPTAAIFASTPELGPGYPDAHDDPLFPQPAPLVQRIVPDMGRPSGWRDIVELLSDENGQPDPAMLQAMTDELNILNASEVIAEILQDSLDTVDHDLVILDASAPANAAGLPILRYVGDVGTTLTGVALNPANGKLLVTNLEARNLVRHERAVKGHIVDHRIELIDYAAFPNLTVQSVDLHASVPDYHNVDVPNALAQRDSLAHPLEIVVDAAGAYGYFPALGTDRVGVVDATTGEAVGRVGVGRGPRGVALDSAANRLYVCNRTDLSISVVDVSAPSNPVVLETHELFNPEPPTLREGRHFLYSTRVSNNFASSCALCHIDGASDHLAWDLGDPSGGLQGTPPNLAPLMNHPLKGPMVTQSLRGLADHDSYHWRSDRPTLSSFNPAFAGLLGGNQLTPADMEAFAAFMESIAYPPNPYFNRDNSYQDPIHALPGAIPFASQCGMCHQVDHDGAMALANADADGGSFVDVPGLFAQLQEIPQLRQLYKKFSNDRWGGFGLLHDGREGAGPQGHPLLSFIAQLFPSVDPEERPDVVAFLAALPTNVMNVVGWQILVQGNADGTVDPTVEADVNLMIAQYAKSPSHCDVTAKGSIGGVTRGFYLTIIDPVPNFVSDDGAAYSLTALFGLPGENDSLTFLAVPPGSGRRIGADRDDDFILDGIDPYPLHPFTGDANSDGYVNVSDFLALIPCYGLAGSLPPVCHVFDPDDNDAVDVSDLGIFLTLYEDLLDDCNANGFVDLVDVLFGAADVDHNGIPDECVTIAVSAVGSRYLSVMVAGQQPVSLFVASPDYPCLAKYIDEEGSLVDAPTIQPPAAWGTIHVGGPLIVPSTAYTVTAGIMTTGAEGAAVTWSWGDTNGAGVVDLDDILCVINAFGGEFDLCSLPGADLMGFTPDATVTLDDILAVVDAFSGADYPGPAPCG